MLKWADIKKHFSISTKCNPEKLHFDRSACIHVKIEYLRTEIILICVVVCVPFLLMKSRMCVICQDIVFRAPSFWFCQCCIFHNLGQFSQY